jgi:hypothetical protein
MYGSRAEFDKLEWMWVEDQLATAGGYWVVPPRAGHPHPRPVWGIWRDVKLYLSIGSPEIGAYVRAGGPVTVHLGSVNEVVIVEGVAVGAEHSSDLLDAYNAKYDWDYTVEDYGPLTVVAPVKVMAWRSAGWAGREGFQATGRWSWPTSTD